LAKISQMKHLIFLFLILPLLGMSQDDPARPKEYSEVVVVDSTLTKNDLFSIFSDWVAKTYISANDVIQYRDKEEGKITAKGVFKVYLDNIYGPAEAGYVQHTISLSFKDGKYKYVINQIYFNGALGKAEINETSPPGMMMRGQWKKIKAQSDYEIKNIILSMSLAINKARESKEW